MNIDSAVLQEVLLGVGLFTAVVLILVFVILAARSRLVATGNVKVVVNDELELAVPVGGKLMQTTLGQIRASLLSRSAEKLLRVAFVGWHHLP